MNISASPYHLRDFQPPAAFPPVPGGVSRVMPGHMACQQLSSCWQVSTGRGAWLVPQRPDNFHDDPHFQWMAGETDGCGPGPAGACPLPCFLARAVAQPALGSSVPGLFLCAQPLAVTPLCLAPHASNGSRSPPRLAGTLWLCHTASGPGPAGPPRILAWLWTDLLTA